MLTRLLLTTLLILAPPAFARTPRVDGTGTMLAVASATRAYAIQSDDGTLYEPIAVKKAFREDGLRVRFTAVPQARQKATIANARVIKLVKLALLDDARGRLVVPAKTASTRIPSSR